jgi:DNA polymerase I-like protein with 3'-5' exonuclease and polymerase domains
MKPVKDKGTAVRRSSPTDTAGYEISVESTGNTQPFRLITRAEELVEVSSAVEESGLVGLDVETTGLDPNVDRIRLLQLAITSLEGGRGVYILDLFALAGVDLTPLWEALRTAILIGHNIAFDLQFLAGLGFAPGHAQDTRLLSQLVQGSRKQRGFHGLKDTAARELKVEVGKEEQTSDWSARVLTTEQLNYAARDAAILLPLRQKLRQQIQTTDQEQVAILEARCLPAVAWMSRSGVGFDQAAWNRLAADAAARVEDLTLQLNAVAPPRPGFLPLIGQDGWSWSAPAQVKEVFELLGHKLASTDDGALADVNHPLAGLLREHRRASKLASTYGPDWPKNAYREGRLYAHWQQIGADSGRMACSAPNLQNLPHADAYRRCFVASPGRLLVKADYSQIELRIAAQLTGDKALRAAYAAGEDLHTLTARKVLGVAEVTKEQRKLAKALNFGLLYGMSARGFRDYAKGQYGLELTEIEANAYRNGFFDAYPGLRTWHQRVQRVNASETRTLAGRRRLTPPRHRDANGKWRGTALPERLNIPVQGTGADGLKQAMALLWETRRQCPDALLVLAVHDELVLETDADKAEAITAWLRRCMVEGMQPLLPDVPVEVEISVARTWGGD